jgi:hypothetical protein
MSGMPILNDGASITGFDAENIQTDKEKRRDGKIPGGMTGIWIVGGLGGIGVIFAFIVGLIPPAIFPDAPLFVGSVLIGTFLLAVQPLVFMRFKKPSWAIPQDQGDNP